MSNPDDNLGRIVGDIANILFGLENNNADHAKRWLYDAWQMIMTGAVTPVTQAYIDRCSEGGFAMHHDNKSLFVKKLPNQQAAEQQYAFARRYSSAGNYLMMKAETPFIYQDKGLVLYLVHFARGMDLGAFFLEASKKRSADNFVKQVTEKCIDDLAFWQGDAGNAMAARPAAPEDILGTMKENTLRSVRNAGIYGGISISELDLVLLERSLKIFDGLTFNQHTIVVGSDYCPKNMGIKTDSDKDDLSFVMNVMSSNGVDPDPFEIATLIYHWDPSARWTHWLEDLAAFTTSYEFHNANRKTRLSDWLHKLCSARSSLDPSFKGWIAEQEPSRVHQELSLMILYRALRKADLTATLYAWRNENIGQKICPADYTSVSRSLDSQLSGYSATVGKAVRWLSEGYGPGRIYTPSTDKEAASIFSQYGAEIPVPVCLGFFNYLAQKLRPWTISYPALKQVKNPSEFAR